MAIVIEESTTNVPYCYGFMRTLNAYQHILILLHIIQLKCDTCNIWIPMMRQLGK